MRKQNKIFSLIATLAILWAITACSGGVEGQIRVPDNIEVTARFVETTGGIVCEHRLPPPLDEGSWSAILETGVMLSGVEGVRDERPRTDIKGDSCLAVELVTMKSDDGNTTSWGECTTTVSGEGNDMVTTFRCGRLR